MYMMPNFNNFAIFGILLAFFNDFIKLLPMIILNCFNIKYYEVNTSSVFKSITNKIPKQALYMYNDKPNGWIFGWPYIGYITRDFDNNKLWIITTTSYYGYLSKTIKKKSEATQENPRENIEITFKCGSFANPFYRTEHIDIKSLPEPRLNQKKIIDNIKQLYEKKKNVSCFIHGKPGSGKSMIPLILAKQYKSVYANCYDFTEPGCFLGGLYSSIRDNEQDDSPVIVVVEEFDILLRKIHNGEVKQHKSVRVEVKNKSDYNTLMDSFAIGIYYNIILVFTSNTPLDEINQMDASYLRPGRIDLIEHI